MAERRTLFVYGNCQAGCIAQFLRRSPDFNAHFEIPRVRGVHEISQEEALDLHERIRQADVVISQNISPQFRGEIYSSSYISSIMKPTSAFISYPSLYFGGYFPNLIYLRDPTSGRLFTGPGGDYHDTNILNAFLASDNIAQAVDRLTDQSLYNCVSLKNNVEQSISELHRREAHLDINVANFLEKNYINSRLFYVFNHPSNHLMYKVCESIAHIFGLSFDSKEIGHVDEWLSATSFPIHPSVYHGLNLRFQNEQFYSIAKRYKVPMEEAISIFFDYYTKNSSCIEAYISISKNSK